MTIDALKQKPFADLRLPPVPAAKPARKSFERETIRIVPVYTRKLAEELKMSAAEIAKLIGCSINTIGIALRDADDADIYMPYEVACKGIYNERTKEEAPPVSDGRVFVSMLIAPEALNSLKPWLTEAGVNFKVFK